MTGPPCRGFTPELAKWYEAGGRDRAEIIFISSDNDQAAFDEYFAEMPWLAFAYNKELNETLRDQFKVRGIPTLVVVDPATGEVLTDEARDDIDPENVDDSFILWTPGAVLRKKQMQEHGRARMKQLLPPVVQSELRAIGITEPVDKAQLMKALHQAASTQFNKEMVDKRVEEAADGMLQQFGKDGVLAPLQVAVQIGEWLGEIWVPEEVEHYVQPESVRRMICNMEEINQMSELDQDWDQRLDASRPSSESVNQCIKMLTVFSSSGWSLTKEEFTKFLNATIKPEDMEQWEGLFDYCVQEGDKGSTGVSAEVLYKFVYPKVFMPRSLGTIGEHYQSVAGQSKL